MHAESFNEVSSIPKFVPNDSSRALSEASRDAGYETERDGAEQRSQYARKMAEALREQGVLPELALEERDKLPKHFCETPPLKGGVKTDSEKENIHTVKKGDTIWGICRDELRAASGKEPNDHEVHQMVKEVVQINNLKTPEKIHPGDKIKLRPKTECEETPPAEVPAPETSNPPDTSSPPETSEQPPQSGGGEIAPTAYIGTNSELDYLRMKFGAIDRDKNNSVTGEEIDNYRKDNAETLSEQESTVLKKVGAHEAKLEEQSNDEFGDEHQGITRQDITLAEKRMKAIEYAQENFRTLDGNSDNHVTADEIESYRRINDERLGSFARADLEFLKSDVSNLEEKHNDETGDENSGFSEADLAVGLDELGSSTFEPDERILVPYEGQDDFDKNTELVKTSDFTDESLRLFDKLDENGNGRVCENELARAVASDEYKGKDAQVVAALYSARKEISEQNDDDWFVPDSGITKADLSKLDQLRQKNETEVQQVTTAVDYLEKDDNFSRVDADGNKFLNQEELSAALQSTELTKKERASLEFLRDHKDQIEATKNDEFFFENSGMSMTDLKWFGDNTIGKIAFGMARTHEAQTSGTRELYSNYERPFESITPDAVKQGSIGDCHFEAAVASLAAVDRNQIQEMIKKNGDGTYTVTFPGAPEEPITVTAPTEAEMGLYNQGGEKGSWACVLEKAYGAFCKADPLRRSIFNAGGGNTLNEAGGNGENHFSFGAAMTLLTGKPHQDELMLLASEETLAKRLNETLNGKPARPVYAGIFDQFFSDESADGYPDQHMYSVLAFDPKGADGGTVTVRNPWGHGEGPDGTFKISVKAFKKNFHRAAFGT